MRPALGNRGRLREERRDFAPAFQGFVFCLPFLALSHEAMMRKLSGGLQSPKRTVGFQGAWVSESKSRAGYQSDENTMRGRRGTGKPLDVGSLLSGRRGRGRRLRQRSQLEQADSEATNGASQQTEQNQYRKTVKDFEFFLGHVFPSVAKRR